MSFLDEIQGDDTGPRDENDFRRRGPQGPPMVASLTKTRQPTGNKAELLAKAEARGLDIPAKVTIPQLKELLGTEPALETYGRPSSYGDEIDNGYALIKWKERQVALGIAIEPQVLERLQDIDPADEKATLDGIVARAHEVADSSMAADRGTFVHSLTEWAEDQSYPISSLDGAPWRDPRFNITDDQAIAIANGWLKALADNGFESVTTEHKVINDRLHIAGTLDRHLRATRAIDYVISVDRVLSILEGDIVCGDVKTSKLHAEDDGTPSFWATYPLQVLGYTEGVPYDVHTDQRCEWPYTLNTDVALIAHLDIEELADNNRAVWQFIAIDLAVARQGVAAVEAVRAYHAATKWAMPSTVTAIDVDPMTALKARYSGLDEQAQREFVALGVDMADVAAVRAGLDKVDPFAQPNPEPVARPTTATPPERTPIDEGELHDAIPQVIVDRYAGLDEAQRQWIGEYVTFAARDGNPIDPRDQPTARRVFTYGALVVFASQYINADDTATNRADAEAMLKACWSADVDTVWHLDAPAALTFAQTVNGLTTGRLQPILTPEGVWNLAPAAA